MIVCVILGSPKKYVFVTFWNLNQKVAQGSLKDPFLHPRTSKLSFPGTLPGHFFTKMLPKGITNCMFYFWETLRTNYRVPTTHETYT